jgi:hypothetical protein
MHRLHDTQITAVLISLKCDNFLGTLKARKKWYYTAYDGVGVQLPWDERVVISPECEQGLMHAFFAVAHIVKGTHFLSLSAGAVLADDRPRVRRDDG